MKCFGGCSPDCVRNTGWGSVTETFCLTGADNLCELGFGFFDKFNCASPGFDQQVEFSNCIGRRARKVGWDADSREAADCSGRSSTRKYFKWRIVGMHTNAQ